MRKYILVLAAFFVVISTFSSSTSSLFTDQETSNSNVLSAGTLDLTVDDKEGVNIESINLTNLYPGSSESHSFILKNIGSIAGKPNICIKNVINIESTGTTEYESDGNPGELGSVVYITPKINSEDLVDFNTNLDSLNNSCWNPDNSTDLEFFNTGADILEENESAIFILDVLVPQTTGNSSQGDSVSFDVEFNLEQN